MSGRAHRVGEVADDWAAVIAELTLAFETAREAALAGDPLVFVVHNDDLLGRRGAGNAMVATGLLSAARTAALEGAKSGWRVNVLAIDHGADPEVVQQWEQRLLDGDGVSGELIRVGTGHLGKALP